MCYHVNGQALLVSMYAINNPAAILRRVVKTLSEKRRAAIAQKRTTKTLVLEPNQARKGTSTKTISNRLKRAEPSSNPKLSHHSTPSSSGLFPFRSLFASACSSAPLHLKRTAAALLQNSVRRLRFCVHLGTLNLCQWLWIPCKISPTTVTYHGASSNEY